MLTNAQELIWQAPALAVWPGLLIFATVIAFNFSATVCRMRWTRGRASREPGGAAGRLVSALPEPRRLLAAGGVIASPGQRCDQRRWLGRAGSRSQNAASTFSAFLCYGQCSNTIDSS